MRQVRGLVSRQGCCTDRGVMQVFEGIHTGCLGSRWGFQDGQRDHAGPWRIQAGVLEGHRGKDSYMHVYLWTWRVLCMCLQSWTLVSINWRRGRGLSCLCLYFMWVQCVSTVEVSPGLWQPMWLVMSVSCVYLCVCVWNTCSALLLVESAKGKVSAVCPSLGRDAGCPGTGLGLSVWTAVLLGWTGWRSDWHTCSSLGLPFCPPCRSVSYSLTSSQLGPPPVTQDCW